MQRREVASHECHFLCRTPSFQLTLASHCASNRNVLFRVRNRDWPSACRIRRSETVVVDLLPPLDIARVTNIESSVCATNDIDPGHRTTMPSSSSPESDTLV